MDLLTSIFDEIKSRFGNRLVINVIIYWLLFNWKITVALFWYDTTQIEAEGCRSTFEFISDQLENNSHWCLVFIYSLISTVLLPIIKMLILVFDAEVKVSRTNWISRVEKDNLFNRAEKLQKSFNDISNVSFLNGKWEFKETNKQNENINLGKNNNIDISTINYVVNINKSQISTISIEGKDVFEKDKYLIKDFTFNAGGNYIFFKKLLNKDFTFDYTGNYEKEILAYLNIEYDFNGRIKLTGYENFNYVEYVKLI